MQEFNADRGVQQSRHDVHDDWCKSCLRFPAFLALTRELTAHDRIRYLQYQPAWPIRIPPPILAKRSEARILQELPPWAGLLDTP